MAPPKGRAPRKKTKKVLGKRKRAEKEEAEAIAEVERLSKELGVPLVEVPEMLADDRLEYHPPEALRKGGEGTGAGEEGEETPVGSLYTIGTVDCYVAAIVELYDIQLANGSNRHPHPRGAGLEGLLAQRKRDRDKNDRAAFVDRGQGGISAGYSAEEFLRMQEVLLKGAAQHPQVSLLPFYELLLTTYLHRIYERDLTYLLGTILSSVERAVACLSWLTLPFSSTPPRGLHLALPWSAYFRAGRPTRAARRSSWGPCATRTPCSVR